MIVDERLPGRAGSGDRTDPAVDVAAGDGSAARRARASALKTPFGNCARYASYSAGFELFMIDCQNRFSCSAVPASGACAAAGASAATADPEPPAVRNASTAGPSRYPVARPPRDDCQFRIATHTGEGSGLSKGERTGAVERAWDAIKSDEMAEVGLPRPCAPSPGLLRRRGDVHSAGGIPPDSGASSHTSRRPRWSRSRRISFQPGSR